MGGELLNTLDYTYNLDVHIRTYIKKEDFDYFICLDKSKNLFLLEY